MQITKGSVVEFHYRITNPAGEELETTRTGDPAAILHGYGNVIRGLEAALEKREVGDVYSVTIPPSEAYGERQADRTERLSKKYFTQPKKLKPGQITQLNTESGVKPVTVVKVGSKVVDVDLNHPQAGVELTFDIEIMMVREATKEETEHKHAHGTGHHHH